MHNLYPYRASDCIVFKLACYTYMHMACRGESGGMAGGTGTENIVSEMWEEPETRNAARWPISL